MITTEAIGDELSAVILAHIERHPRSLQVELGPSEIGTECARKLAYKVAGVAPVNDSGAPWFPTIGTAVHTWLEGALHADNVEHRTNRYWTETTVRVGEINGQPVIGHADVYDRETGTVVDWKIIGTRQLAKYKADGPGRQYRSQAQLYGRGFVALGMPVNTVGIYFLPRADLFDRGFFWSERYDEQVALDALTRAEAIVKLVAACGVKAIGMVPTADDYCRFCPHWLPASTELEQACPGHVAGTTSPGLAST